MSWTDTYHHDNICGSMDDNPTGDGLRLTRHLHIGKTVVLNGILRCIRARLRDIHDIDKNRQRSHALTSEMCTNILQNILGRAFANPNRAVVHQIQIPGYNVPREGLPEKPFFEKVT